MRNICDFVVCWSKQSKKYKENSLDEIQILLWGQNFTNKELKNKVYLYLFTSRLNNKYVSWSGWLSAIFTKLNEVNFVQSLDTPGLMETKHYQICALTAIKSQLSKGRVVRAH